MGRFKLIVELNIIFILQVERTVKRSRRFHLFIRRENLKLLVNVFVLKRTKLKIKFTEVNERTKELETLNIYMDGEKESAIRR